MKNGKILGAFLVLVSSLTFTKTVLAQQKAPKAANPPQITQAEFDKLTAFQKYIHAQWLTAAQTALPSETQLPNKIEPETGFCTAFRTALQAGRKDKDVEGEALLDAYQNSYFSLTPDERKIQMIQAKHGIDQLEDSNKTHSEPEFQFDNLFLMVHVMADKAMVLAADAKDTGTVTDMAKRIIDLVEQAEKIEAKTAGQKLQQAHFVRMKTIAQWVLNNTDRYIKGVTESRKVFSMMQPVPR